MHIGSRRLTSPRVSAYCESIYLTNAVTDFSSSSSAPSEKSSPGVSTVVKRTRSGPGNSFVVLVSERVGRFDVDTPSRGAWGSDICIKRRRRADLPTPRGPTTIKLNGAGARVLRELTEARLALVLVAGTEGERVKAEGGWAYLDATGPEGRGGVGWW